MTIFDRFPLKGRVALVTGGGRGLGLEIARALAEAGAHAVINGRTSTTLEGAVSQIASAGGSAENDATAFKAASSQNEQNGRFSRRAPGVKNASPWQRGKIEPFQWKNAATSMGRSMLPTDRTSPNTLLQ